MTPTPWKPLSLATAVLIMASPAHAWTPIDGNRPTWPSAVPYSLHSAGSADLGFGQTQTEVQRGMEDWGNASCEPGLSFSYNGSTSTRPGRYEGTSVIGWIESGWSDDPNAIGVTGPQWTISGSNIDIVEADMLMNGEDYTWITGSGRGDNVNAYSIILHESGHYLGLGHSNDSDATMFFAYQGGIDSLGSDDSTGICTLYPGSGGVPSCETTGCSPGYSCVDGTCERQTGDGSNCAICFDGSECDSGYCLQYPDGAGYCADVCTNTAACGASSLVCGDFGNVGLCIGVDTSGNYSCTDLGGTPTGCTRDTDCESDERCNRSTGDCEAGSVGADLGATCDGSADCASGLCVRGVCTRSCDGLDVTSCPSGFYCDATTSGSCGDGLCVAGTFGEGLPESACSRDSDCASLYCAGGVCAEPCVPGGTTSCDAGYACQASSSGGCGACRKSGAIGDSCEDNNDCTSSICATSGDASFCTTFCDVDSTESCPDQFACEAISETTAVCAPSLGGLGAACAGNGECLENLCVQENGSNYCTRKCTDTLPCPGDRYTCEPVVGQAFSVCSPSSGPAAGGSDRDDGCGCSVVGASTRRASTAWLALALALLGLALRRRVRA